MPAWAADTDTFQSTLPARGATLWAVPLFIHPEVSIHAPRAGSDRPRNLRELGSCWFQSTLPARGATPFRPRPGTGLATFQSTLPARGATSRSSSSSYHETRFNPRSPRGERHPKLVQHNQRDLFQSTLPARGATPEERLELGVGQFQSTLPARGATRTVCCDTARGVSFNPRSPRGERRERLHHAAVDAWVSIHAPRAGSDGW